MFIHDRRPRHDCLRETDIIFEEAGFPPGVLSMVAGPGSVIGDAFLLHAGLIAETISPLSREAAVQG